MKPACRPAAGAECSTAPGGKVTAETQIIHMKMLAWRYESRGSFREELGEEEELLCGRRQTEAELRDEVWRNRRTVKVSLHRL